VLGETRGFAKRNRHYWHHGQKKIVLVRPLVPDAVARLMAPFLPASHGAKEIAMLDVNAFAYSGPCEYGIRSDVNTKFGGM
jgi:hypothetical protein